MELAAKLFSRKEKINTNAPAMMIGLRAASIIQSYEIYKTI